MYTAQSTGNQSQAFRCLRLYPCSGPIKEAIILNYIVSNKQSEQTGTIWLKASGVKKTLLSDGIFQELSSQGPAKA